MDNKTLVLVILVYLLDLSKTKKILKQHFTSLRFGLDSVRLIGHYPVHNHQQISLHLHFNLSSPVLRKTTEQPLAFHLHIYYAKHYY